MPQLRLRDAEMRFCNGEECRWSESWFTRVTRPLAIRQIHRKWF